jgi:hypothetical protein
MLDDRRQLSVGHDLTLLAFDMFIKESKHIVLPLRDRKVNEIVSVVRGSTDRRINFQQMRLVQISQLAQEFFQL